MVEVFNEAVLTLESDGGVLRFGQKSVWKSGLDLNLFPGAESNDASEGRRNVNLTNPAKAVGFQSMRHECPGTRFCNM